MDQSEGLKKIKMILEQATLEQGKVSAASCLLEARMKEVEAAIYLGDWESVERARYAAVGAFEHFMDARISACRHLKREADKL